MFSLALSLMLELSFTLGVEVKVSSVGKDFKMELVKVKKRHFENEANSDVQSFVDDIAGASVQPYFWFFILFPVFQHSTVNMV